MKRGKLLKNKKLVITVLISFFSFYFVAVIYFSFGVDPLIVFQSIVGNRLFLIALILLFSIMLFLVLYNLFQVVMERIKNREGSKFRLRLTVFFLVVTLIPIVPLSLISNNLIAKSINLWFMSGIEGSLMDAMEVSKELYNRLSYESRDEWEDVCADCSEDDMGSIPFKAIDGILSYTDGGGEVRVIFLRDMRVMEAFDKTIKFPELDVHGWKRVSLEEQEFLLIPVRLDDDRSYILVRNVPDNIRSYTSTISAGLQNYRTLKIIREPVKGIIILLFIVLIMPFVLLSFYLSLLISREVTDPIKALAIATQKVADDELTYTIELEAKDELKLLIDSFNKMTRDLRVNKELLKHSERSAAWRDIARKIAHEIKNPLTPIRLSAERMLKLYSKNDRYREVLTKGIDTIFKEVETITDMVNEFSDFARFPDTKLSRHDIIPIINGVLDFLRDAHKDIGFTFTHTEDSVYLMVDAAQIRRALLNIIYNSINAIRDKGSISISCYPGKDTGNGSYIIAISDNGIGIDPDIRDSIFDPYFSKDGRGAGLGLTIVEKIVLDNKGKIWFESEPGITTFYMEFAKA